MSALYQWVKASILGQSGAVFDSKPLHLNFLGVRGLWHGAHVTNVFNEYNDTIYVCFLDAFGVETVQGLDASCDPGKLDPAFTNKKGVAHLVPGQHWFRRGLHHGIRALVQSRPVTVKRFDDSNPNSKLILDTGWFGINIHAGGTSSVVGNWSAGCQVVCGGWVGAAWKNLDALLYVQADPSQAEIPYTLVDGASLSLPP